ncbi:MAG: 4-(cytidine 5'-diphospho)-2-C-methyl-D-erythritol kinase [Acidobacteriota bacterium]|nr:4-(cytidine 5'-diphospho)-2-C-methyl-D-erythritol kinase [Acidobacteriota bacterium]MDE3161730.1 4-(cytidine 5'-diphospho)-2-C-methyl-D-erythritol kinase [Acidobacteriota bacterium]
MSTRVRSHAKINLGLGIGAPRPDGFHALSTVYQTLEVHDLVTVTARRAGETHLTLTSNDGRVPTDARNTAWKMIALALDEIRVKAEVAVHIEKRLPVQGGLGAGSANAVAALVGLEAELERLGPAAERPGTERQESKGLGAGWAARRLELAAQVGSDVPLFLIGGAVLGMDRGQEVVPLPDFEPVWCVVATPAVGVSTPQAFRDWDALCATEGLTGEASDDKLKQLSRAYASAFAGGFPQGGQRAGSSGVASVGGDLAGRQESALVRTGITSWIVNDFERVVFHQHPSLAEIKRLLAAAGTPEAALHASLSGSGSALFGLYLTRGDAEAAQRRLAEAGTESLLTRTLPRAGYWSEMLLPQAG